MLKKYLKPISLPNQVSLAVLVLRLSFGFLMIPHGYDKLQEFLKGNSQDFPDPLHVSPMISHGLTVFAEFFCSILLVLGLFTRPALVILIGCMAIISFSIHGSDPLGDKEHAFLYLFAYVSVFLTGAGKYSIDSVFFK
jgi:putative oxidoreductase